MKDRLNDRVPPSLKDLTEDLSQVAYIDRRNIPALLTQLSALQSSMAARLIEPLSENTASENPETDHRLLTAHEASQRLGVSADWLYRRTRSLPFVVRLGRNVRFSAQGIENFVRRRVGRG
jgi:predicted DNA-binding transcriptional regulator AlpA